MTKNRISLWSGPRNVSTAFMYSFAQRPDTRVMDEPLYGHYLRVSGAQHPGRDEVLDKMELDGDTVVQEIRTRDYQRPVLFIKNMAHHLEGLEMNVLDGFKNMLLIRDPGEMIPSMIKQLPNPIMRDTGLRRQWEIFQYLEKEGTPLVIDSRELLLNPEYILNKVCQSLGIPYIPEMLRWSPGSLEEDGIWAKYWYHNVHKSSGFQPYKPKTIPVPPHLSDLLVECEYYYKLLHKHALKAPID